MTQNHQTAILLPILAGSRRFMYDSDSFSGVDGFLEIISARTKTGMCGIMILAGPVELRCLQCRLPL
jgi:hypothetical protein